MWVINNYKERIKAYLRTDVESNITNITELSNRIQDTISAINRVVSGTVSGEDRQMINDCQRSLQELSIAIQILYSCRDYVDQLDTEEWYNDQY